jgi:hypothetical protein
MWNCSISVFLFQLGNFWRTWKDKFRHDEIAASLPEAGRDAEQNLGKYE